MISTFIFWSKNGLTHWKPFNNLFEKVKLKLRKMKLWVRQKYFLQVTKPLILKIIRSYGKSYYIHELKDKRKLDLSKYQTSCNHYLFFRYACYHLYFKSLNLNEDGRKTLTHTLKNRINILPATGRRMMTKNRRFFDVDVSWIITKMLDVTHRTRATTLCIWDSNKYTEIKEPLEYAKYC